MELGVRWLFGAPCPHDAHHIPYTYCMTNENTKLKVVAAAEIDRAGAAEKAGAVESADDEKPKPPTVGFSRLERLPVGLMPDELCSKADRLGMALTATEIYEQAEAGSSPKAIKRILSRQITSSRKQVAFFESLRTFAVTRMVQGKLAYESWVKLFDRLADGEHKRLLASIDTLQKLQTPPSVNIRARQAAVLVDQRSDSGGGET